MSTDYSSSDPGFERMLIAEIKAFPVKAERRLRRAVEQERSRHAYQNRTGDAERETRFQVVSDDGNGNVELEAEMGVEYASYLNANGWSDFDRNIEAAREAIRADFLKLVGGR